jgi:hypothetical protein
MIVAFEKEESEGARGSRRRCGYDVEANVQ